MPTRLARAELARLGAFPEAIDRDDPAEHFRPSGDDLEFVRAQRGAASQLGIALQLCALRWLGFIPEDLAGGPAAAVESLAVALDVPARAVFDHAVRSPTRREHRLAVRAHAGWRAFGDPEAAEFRAALAELALEHDRPAFLFTRACEQLRGRRVERPAIDRLVRLVAWARERAHERTFELLGAQLTEPVCASLDALLAPDASSKRARTPLSWLRSRPTTVRAGALRGELQKREYLIERVGADRLDLSGLPPNRRALLAQQGAGRPARRSGGWRRGGAIRRSRASAQTLERVTDDALEVFDRALGSADRRAQRKRDELRRRHGRDTQSTLRRFIDVTRRLLLEARESNTDVLGLIDRRIGLERLGQDLRLAERIVRPTGDTHLDLLIADDDHSRKMLGELNAALTFHRTGEDDDELLGALRLIAELAGTNRRWLPGFSPSAFIDGRWRPLVADVSRGRLDRRGSELCAACELRTALRAGRVWVQGSRRHADPASYLLPEQKWRPVRVEFAARVRRRFRPANASTGSLASRPSSSNGSTRRSTRKPAHSSARANSSSRRPPTRTRPGSSASSSPSGCPRSGCPSC